MAVFHVTFASMNTRLSVIAADVAGYESARLERALRGIMADQEQLMSRFAPTAELAGVNARAGAGPVRVSARLWTILTACADHWRRTGGAFDIAHGSGEDPDAARGAWRVRLDRTARTVAFAHRGVTLDLGGVGKGLALRRLGRLLRRFGVNHGLASFGESSILAVGAHPSGADWLIAMDLPIASPPVFSLRDGAISTSAQAPGRAAILDPASGRAAPSDRLLSVACGCPIDAEVLSTALLARPDRRESILAHYRPARVIDHRLPVTSSDSASTMEHHG